MADPRTYRPVDRFVYAGVFIYLAVHGFGDRTDYLNHAFRIPGIALILLVVTQILFPRFRASGLANVIAFLVIILSIIHTLQDPPYS